MILAGWNFLASSRFSSMFSDWSFSFSCSRNR